MMKENHLKQIIKRNNNLYPNQSINVMREFWIKDIVFKAIWVQLKNFQFLIIKETHKRKRKQTMRLQNNHHN